MMRASGSRAQICRSVYCLVRPLNSQMGVQTAEFVMTKGPCLSATSWLTALLLYPLVQLAAQDKPDFSGSWVLESGAQVAADIPQMLSVIQTLVRTNVRGEPMSPFYKDISVTRVLESGRRSEIYHIGVVGGTVPPSRGERVGHTADQHACRQRCIERGATYRPG
jgi:hypothetical protein